MMPQYRYNAAVVEESNSMMIHQFDVYIKNLMENNAELKSENKRLKNILKEKNKLLNDTKIRANQSEVMKNEFLAQISHEIRTPLNIIINYNDLIKDELKNYITEETELFFNAIEVDSKRLIRTIDLMLNMSQLKNGNYKPALTSFDVVNILSSVISDFKLEANDKNLDLVFENSAAGKIILADRYAVQQVFTNLISNAIKFTTQGYIKIKVYNIDENIHSSGSPTGEHYRYVCIDVEDSGQGISEEYLKNLFEPFSQEDHGFSRTHDGNGLGLALVKKYLQLNDGSLAVVSNKGRGSVFTVKFKVMWK